MTCREVDQLLLSASGNTELPASAREHVSTCMECQSLVSAMAMVTSPASQSVDPEVLARIRQPVISTLKPVRPMAPSGMFMAAFLVIIAGAAALAADRLGFYGIRALTPVALVAIFAVLLVIAVLASFATARYMRPGQPSIRGGVLAAIAIIAAEAVFLSVFHDYSMGKFVHWGMGCFRAGLECAFPAALLVWVLVRRGYVVSPVSTGAGIGVIAGIAGLAALELHCPILTIPHVAVWHAAVLVVSVGAGAFAGWLARLVDRRHAIR